MSAAAGKLTARTHYSRSTVRFLSLIERHFIGGREQRPRDIAQAESYAVCPLSASFGVFVVVLFVQLRSNRSDV